MEKLQKKDYMPGWAIAVIGVLLFLFGKALGGSGGAIILLTGFCLLSAGVILWIRDIIRSSKSKEKKPNTDSNILQKFKRKQTLIIPFIVLILSILVFYPLYAKNSCAASADRHNAYARNGTLYSELTDTNGNHITFLTRENYINLCMQDQFKL